MLSSALELDPEIDDWHTLRGALETHPDVICKNRELTLCAIRFEEAATVWPCSRQPPSTTRAI